MASIQRTKNKKTGKFHPKWRYQYTDRFGVRRTATGLTTERETKRMAEEHEARERAYRTGQLECPSIEHKTRLRTVEEVMDEYLAWGEAQGGRGGRPWDIEHAAKKRSHLTEWRLALKFEFMADCVDCLAAVEKVQRSKGKGLSGKTLANKAEALTGFFNWCVKRRYLKENPVRDLGRYDTTPRKQRRCMTQKELIALITSVPFERRFAYVVALETGLRASELRALTVSDLDAENCCLRLRADETKNRKAAIQPLRPQLVAWLHEFAKSGRAKAWYKRVFARKGDISTVPADPLLCVPRGFSKAFEKDLAKAGIPKETPEGFANFHGLRVAFASHLAAANTPVKELQTLMRHSTPSQTMNIYAKLPAGALAHRVESVMGEFLPDTIFAERGQVTSLSALPAGSYMVGVRGFEPPAPRPPV